MQPRRYQSQSRKDFVQSRLPRRGPVASLGAALLAGGLLAEATQAQAEGDQAHYRIEVSRDLATLNVSARFAKPVTTLRARDRDAARFLLDPTDCSRSGADAQPDTELAVRRRTLRLPAGGVTCLHYRVDLAAAAAGERRNTYLATDNRSVSPSLWLWRPSLRGGDSLRIDFDLPEGINVAVPWQPVIGTADAYRLSASPESSHAPALFGNFSYHQVGVGDATLRVALARGREPYREGEIINWVTATATDVSLTYGRFPNPSPLVLIVPVASERRWGRSPVPFGRVIRDGGEAVELFVDPAGNHGEFMADWTATHEFSHLMLPYLASSARWVSEGFAQYYQNVLMARSGAYEESVAWQKIMAGLRRGAASGPGLSPNEAANGNRRGARMKVYWSGAALALLGDLELRRVSNGEQSLDSVLDDLQRCCLPSADVWSGPTFFAKLDELSGRSVFMPLYRQHADRAGFPDVSAELAALGVLANGRLNDRADLASLRRQIMRRSESVADWRREMGESP